MPAKIVYKKGDRLNPKSKLSYIKDASIPANYKFKKRRALFSCDCGNSHIAIISSVKNGSIQSCGCVLNESRHKGKHGMSNSPEYSCWKSIRRRCDKPDSEYYKDYGERGITVCSRWYEFESFYADMGNKPAPHATEGIYSIERIDNNKGYSPSNCKWATNFEQQRNKRSNVNLTAFGVTKCLNDWAKDSGLHKDTIRWRIRHGWSIASSVSTPSRQQKRGVR